MLGVLKRTITIRVPEVVIPTAPRLRLYCRYYCLRLPLRCGKLSLGGPQVSLRRRQPVPRHLDAAARRLYLLHQLLLAPLGLHVPRPERR